MRHAAEGADAGRHRGRVGARQSGADGGGQDVTKEMVASQWDIGAGEHPLPADHDPAILDPCVGPWTGLEPVPVHPGLGQVGGHGHRSRGHPG